MTPNTHRPSTLIIIDVQAAFPVPPRLVERIRKYARRFKRRVFTRFINPPGSTFRRALNQKCCAPGSPDTQLLVAPGPDDLVIDKSTYGLEPATIRKLKRLKISEVVVCGVDTDACVLGVMFSLFDAGIVCHPKLELCWSSTGLHRQACGIIQKQFPQRR